MKKDLIALLILDGWGIGKHYKGNAITLADTKNYDQLMKNYPSTELIASGEEVGLPEGQMGNSEVGHLNIGAGRVVYQELTRITKSIEDGEFCKRPKFIEAAENCKKHNSDLHLMGLVSDGGVHSHINHLFALLEFAKQQELKNVYVHCFLDGRDTHPQSGEKYIKALEDKMQELGIGKIATVMGRYYALDRDQRWDRIERAYNAMVLGKGDKISKAEYCLLNAYPKKITDEFIPPSVVTDKDGKPTATIKDNDSVIFFNFRPDRAKQITRSIVNNEDECEGFDRKIVVDPFFVCMTMYDNNIKNVCVEFESQSLENTLGEYLSKNKKTQLRIAETEKYAHVTSFFNGGVEQANFNEERILIPSPRVATYNLQPSMSAVKIKDEVIDKIKQDKYDFITLNFANPDMLGHTGELESTIDGIEIVDNCLGEIIDQILKVSGKAIITADHGNAEKMIDEETGERVTSHTTNKVPFIVVGQGDIELNSGKLADIAPTILEMMNLEKPLEMTGISLIKK